MPGKDKRRSRRKRRQVRRKRRTLPSKMRNARRSVTQRARNTPANLQSNWAWAQGRENMAKIQFQSKKGKTESEKPSGWESGLTIRRKNNPVNPNSNPKGQRTKRRRGIDGCWLNSPEPSRNWDQQRRSQPLRLTSYVMVFVFEIKDNKDGAMQLLAVCVCGGGSTRPSWLHIGLKCSRVKMVKEVYGGVATWFNWWPLEASQPRIPLDPKSVIGIIPTEAHCCHPRKKESHSSLSHKVIFLPIMWVAFFYVIIFTL